MTEEPYGQRRWGRGAGKGVETSRRHFGTCVETELIALAYRPPTSTLPKVSRTPQLMSSLSSLAHRGVWIAPWTGPHGELVLFSLNHRNQLVHAPEIVPHGADRVAAQDALWEELDLVDPVTTGALRAPSFRRAARSGREMRPEFLHLLR